MRPLTHTLVGYLRSLLVREQLGHSGLLQRYLASRDGDAFAAILREHGPRVLSVARRVLGEGQDAEDVFQATFLLLSRQAHTIRQPEAVGSWLSRTAFRLALRARRTRHRRAERDTHATPPATRSALDELTGRELLIILDEELARLPESYRWALVLCCLEGLSHEEAARHVGCSPRALRARLERGRKRLRQRLELRGLTLPAVLGAALVAGTVHAVPATLVEMTLLTAATGGPVSSAVATLTNEALRTMLTSKLKVVAAGVAVLLVVSLGLAMVLPAGDPNPAEPPGPKSDPPPVALNVDLHGDALPDGAVMRLGTVKQRAVGARLAFAPDGKSVVGVRDGKFVSVWDAATGRLRERRQLDGDGGAMRSWLSPDGRWAAVQSRHDKLAVWDLKTDRLAHALSVPDLNSFAWATISADSRLIAVSGFRKEQCFVAVWQLDDGKRLFDRDIGGHTLGYFLAFSPDGKRLAGMVDVKDRSGTACWDVPSGEQLWLRPNFVTHSMTFLPDGLILTAGSASQVLDATTGEDARRDNVPRVRPTSLLAQTPDGLTLLVSDPADTKGIGVWDLKDGKERFRLPAAGAKMTVSPDGKTVLTNDGSLQLWDLATGKPLWPESFDLGHAGAVSALTFSPDGKALASAAADGTVRLWDPATGKPLQVCRSHAPSLLGRPHDPGPTGAVTVSFSVDGRRAVSGGDDRVRLTDAKSGEVVRDLALPRRPGGRNNPGVYQVWVRPDGTRAAAVVNSSRRSLSEPPDSVRNVSDLLTVWDLSDGKLLEKRDIPVTSPGWCGFSTDGRVVVAGGVIIDVASGAHVRRLDKDEDQSVGACAVSGDGTLIVGACLRRVDRDSREFRPDGVRVWEGATGQTVAHFKTTTRVGRVAFLQGGRFVAISDADGIQVWDVRLGKPVWTRALTQKGAGMPEPNVAGCIGFTDDGRRLATGHADGTILMWDVALPEDKPAPLGEKEAEGLWAALNGEASKAWPAAWRLAEMPDVTLPLLKEKLKPVRPAPGETTARLLADLDDPSFTKRQAAAQGLRELGPRAESALRTALKGDPSAEQRRQVEGLMESLANPARDLTGEEPRELRAVAVLSRIGGADSLRLLEELAKGVDTAPLTRAAKIVLAGR